ncbi:MULTISPECIES: hypothetical protein [unclassified Sphingomonas]
MTSLALPAPKRASILPYLGVAVVAAAILARLIHEPAALGRAGFDVSVAA